MKLNLEKNTNYGYTVTLGELVYVPLDRPAIPLTAPGLLLGTFANYIARDFFTEINTNPKSRAVLNLRNQYWEIVNILSHERSEENFEWWLKLVGTPVYNEDVHRLVSDLYREIHLPCVGLNYKFIYEPVHELKQKLFLGSDPILERHANVRLFSSSELRSSQFFQ